MGRLTIYKDTDTDSTVISNRFIDEYMTDANDAQLKVYLYLVRMMNAKLPTSISDIADQFNHTEKDVIRSLKYWEGKNLLALEYDAMQNLSGIHLMPLEGQASYQPEMPKPLTVAPMLSFIQQPAQSASIPRTTLQYQAAPQPQLAQAPQYREEEVIDSYQKPSYSVEELKSFKQNDEAATIIFVAEQYIGRPLSPTDLKSLLFIYDKLCFSVDLMDYLLQYCVERGKRDFRYIEKVAIGWAEQGITDVDQARSSSQYDKSVYTMMKWLGKSSNPTAKEREFMDKWTKQYHFSMDLIKEACDRTVMATDTRRFYYADGILTRWAASNVQTMNDVAQLDAFFQRGKTTKSPATGNNKFNQFQQNAYDFDQLEKDILSN